MKLTLKFLNRSIICLVQDHLEFIIELSNQGNVIRFWDLMYNRVSNLHEGESGKENYSFSIINIKLSK